MRAPVPSPTGKYSTLSYSIPYGGAAGGVDVRVEILFEETQDRKTIYYSNVKSFYSQKWTDDDTLKITNENYEYSEYRGIELNIHDEIYDERGAACKSLVLEFERCYHYEQ